MNLPHDNLTSTVQLLYCFGLLGSYPMQVIPAIDITEKTECFTKSPNPFAKINPYIKNIVLRTIIVVFTGIVAQIIPKFGLFINLTGAFSCTLLAFLLPIHMYNTLNKDSLSTRQKYFHYFLLVFGSCAGSVSFFMSLGEILAAFSEEPEAVLSTRI